jgi:hypothetical protein
VSRGGLAKAEGHCGEGMESSLKKMLVPMVTHSISLGTGKQALVQGAGGQPLPKEQWRGG